MPKINFGGTVLGQNGEEIGEPEAVELAVRFDEDRERLKEVLAALREIERLPRFKSGVLNSLVINYLAIGLELTSGPTSQEFILEKLTSLLRNLEAARRRDELTIRPDEPWPWIDPETGILSEEAEKAMGRR
ncbi:hypothetical protein GWM83_04050 [Candidatus Bathyarchaeota archaeon]|nr:hypothetical protein [Candidatus Bathyarchaeota archaeon]NIR15061.1 hypothetical protein [Desulfobacterales bacterium]NIW34714.1 hypothetical protein [Candidatus Bathyarchaeota archaeon]